MMAVFGTSDGSTCICPHQVDLVKDTCTIERGGKVVDVWNQVAIWDSNSVECPVIPPVSKGLLWDNVKGRRPGAGQVLADGRMTPNCSTWSRAILILSWAKPQVRPDNGGPAVGCDG